MILRTVALIFVSHVFVYCIEQEYLELSIETTTHYYYEREVDPTLEAYNVSVPEFKNVTVAIYKSGFKMIIEDRGEERRSDGARRRRSKRRRPRVRRRERFVPRKRRYSDAQIIVTLLVIMFLSVLLIKL